MAISPILSTEHRPVTGRESTPFGAVPFKEILAQAASQPQPSSKVPGGQDVEVKAGDCLERICRRRLKELGASAGPGEISAAVRAVARANRLDNPDRIYPGQSLDLSVLEGLPREEVKASRPELKGWEELAEGAQRVSSDFGLRKNPITGRLRQHEGIDVVAPSGSGVKAPEGGEVSFAGWRRGYGNTVVLRHENGMESVYAHLSKALVKPGEQIKAGETIAKVGSSGSATGAHLHFELRQDGKALDPSAFLKDLVRGRDPESW